MATFRLLNITDLHIAIPPEDNTQRSLWQSLDFFLPSCANRYALEAIAEFVHRTRDQVDLILMSGDIADDGAQPNLDAALRFVATPATDEWFTRRPLSPTMDALRPAGPQLLHTSPEITTASLALTDARRYPIR